MMNVHQDYQNIMYEKNSTLVLPSQPSAAAQALLAPPPHRSFTRYTVPPNEGYPVSPGSLCPTAPLPSAPLPSAPLPSAPPPFAPHPSAPQLQLFPPEPQLPSAPQLQLDQSALLQRRRHRTPPPPPRCRTPPSFSELDKNVPLAYGMLLGFFWILSMDFFK